MGPAIADKKNNTLPLWGNEKTMNLNNLILTNILSSHYFKVNLYQLKTYHEVIDEIYYNVNHLEPWEKGSRKTSGQTGMCGGVRGVGAGGIVSTAFCILYKLFTLKLTRKQLVGLLNHNDSSYIRSLGFMYIRFTQPPKDLWDWYEPYLDDTEEIDPKAGGGQPMTIGDLVRHMLTKLEWFSTLFPRIPVPIQKDLERKLSEYKPPPATEVEEPYGEEEEEEIPPDHKKFRNNDIDRHRDHHYEHGHHARYDEDNREKKKDKKPHHKKDKKHEEKDYRDRYIEEHKDRRTDSHREKHGSDFKDRVRHEEDHKDIRIEDLKDRHGNIIKKKYVDDKRDRHHEDYRDRSLDDRKDRYAEERYRRSSPEPRRDHHGSNRKDHLDLADEIARERERQRKEHKRHRSRSPNEHHRSPHRHHHSDRSHHSASSRHH